MSSIYVYGTTWCGYTQQQIDELQHELQQQGHDASQALRMVDCGSDQERDNVVCAALPGYPLAVVHADDGGPSDAVLAAAMHKLGMRPATDLVAEWRPMAPPHGTPGTPKRTLTATSTP